MTKVRRKIHFDADGIALPETPNAQMNGSMGAKLPILKYHHADTLVLPDTFVVEGQRHSALVEIEAMVRANRYGNGE